MKENTKLKLVFILILMIWYILNILMYENEKIKIDKYNFEQLYTFQSIVNKHDFWKNITSFEDVKLLKKFNSLKEFNSMFNSNITPIKNCYYVSSNNWSYKYIFWFKLESLTYKIKYMSNEYIYPKFDWNNYCTWWCPRNNPIKYNLEKIISYPCEE